MFSENSTYKLLDQFSILSIYGLYTIENDRRHRSVNNVLWRVVAGRMRPAGRQLDTPGLYLRIET